MFNRYFEPFLGGGAMFFALEPANATLSDLNGELISCYKQIRDAPEEVIGHLGKLVNSESDYYRIRNSYPLSEAERAARMIYLTTLSFNGIYRQNKFGVFNVPYGYKTHVNPCDADRIRSVSRLLATATLLVDDFGDVLSRANRGDFIYLDPPYTVAHENNGFIKYNAKIFSWEDQVRLAELAKDLNDKGCHLIISNANHESIKDLYSCFTLEIINRTSVIAASGNDRRLITECIFHNKA